MRTLCAGWCIILLLMKHVEIGITATSTTTTEQQTTTVTTTADGTPTTSITETSVSTASTTSTSATEPAATTASTTTDVTTKADTSTADSQTTTTATALTPGSTGPPTSATSEQSQTVTEPPTTSTSPSPTTKPPTNTTTESGNSFSTTSSNTSISPTPSSAASTATPNSISASTTPNSSPTTGDLATSSTPETSSDLASSSLSSISSILISNTPAISSTSTSLSTSSAAVLSTSEPVTSTTVSASIASSKISTKLTTNFQTQLSVSTAYTSFATLSISSAFATMSSIEEGNYSTISSLTIFSTDSSGVISLISTASSVSTFSGVLPSSSSMSSDISPSSSEVVVPTSMLPSSSSTGPSEPTTPSSQENQPGVPSTTERTGDLQMYYAVSGMSVAGIILIVLILIFLLRMKRRNIACFAVDLELYSPFNDTTEMETLRFRPGPIKLANFSTHLEHLHRNDDMLFVDAFNLLHDDSPTGVSSVSKSEKNEGKNRYANILAFDHSRVKLHPINDDPSTDYINANFIPGYTLTREYIATQGPLPATFDDFWRMVWEQNVDTIVMVTKLVEHGNDKCDKYWPDVGNMEVHDKLIVTTKTETSTRDFTLRTMELGKVGEEPRTVRQYAFVKWPDMGCPDKTSTLLNFVRVVRRTGPKKDASPMVIHCSAGVGRTGTFIAVDHLLQHIRDNDDIDIYNLVLNMRKYRASMIQTEAQLVYIYECIKDYMMADDEEDEAESNDDELEDDEEEEDEGVEADRMLNDWNCHDNPAFE